MKSSHVDSPATFMRATRASWKASAEEGMAMRDQVRAHLTRMGSHPGLIDQTRSAPEPAATRSSVDHEAPSVSHHQQSRADAVRERRIDDNRDLVHRLAREGPLLGAMVLGFMRPMPSPLPKAHATLRRQGARAVEMTLREHMHALVDGGTIRLSEDDLRAYAAWVDDVQRATSRYLGQTPDPTA